MSVNKKIIFNVLDLQGLDYDNLEYQAVSVVEGITPEQQKQRNVVRMNAYGLMIKELLKRVLGRKQDDNVSNIMVSFTLNQYKKNGVNLLSEIVDDLKTLKGAKNRDELAYNIATGARMGERGEGTEIDFDGISF